MTIHHTAHPYWWDIPPVADSPDGNNGLKRLIESIAGAIILFIIGISLCTILTGCASSKQHANTNIDYQNNFAERTEQDIYLNLDSSLLRISSSFYVNSEWYNLNAEITEWSKPDSSGKQHKARTISLNKKGGSRQSGQGQTESLSETKLDSSSSIVQTANNSTELNETEEYQGQVSKTNYRLWIYISLIIGMAAIFLWKNSKALDFVLNIFRKLANFLCHK